MHLNYYFLKKLVPRLAERLTGTRLSAAFSQDKDEIILEFESEGAIKLTIRAILKTGFTCLFFPDRFERARANSIDLFKDLHGQKVDRLFVYENERAFALEFGGGDKLVFKLFGNRSNLLYFAPDGSLKNIFNRRLLGDLTLEEASLHKPALHTFDRFVSLEGDYRKMFPTFGKLAYQYLAGLLPVQSSPEEKWIAVQKVLSELDSDRYYLSETEGRLALSLLPAGDIRQTYTDPIQAVNAFCLSYFRTGNLQHEKDQAAKRLLKRVQQTESYLASAYGKLAEISDAGKNEQYANLIMANLHQVEPRAEFLEVISFYTGEPVKIKLKADLSAARNAENYFRKAKNEKQELARLQENIEAREAALDQMKIWLSEIEKQSAVKDLRAFLKQHGLSGQEGGQASGKAGKFREETFLGYRIFIGKNAKNNDELTLKLAGKEDLWLHAKDVSGSHVIIRHIPGRNFPAVVIERAAELAAWHSKRRNDSLCPVIVTPRKFVRKGKGMPAGAVSVEKESVVMVVPRE